MTGWKTTHLDANAIQCWTAMEEFYGVVPCTLMSMMSNTACPLRLRDRYRRRGGYVCDDPGLRQAQRHCRLEQQLRRRPRQSRHLPLLQPAQRPVCGRIDLRAECAARWITRPSSPARLAKTTPTAPLSAASRPSLSPTAASLPTISMGRFFPISAKPRPDR